MEDLTENLTHTYTWGNLPCRRDLKGKKCRIVAAGAMNTVQVEFENGHKVFTSRRALRKIFSTERIER